MKHQLLRAGDERTWAVVFAAGDEAAARLGDISRGDDGPIVHAHVVVATSTGDARGGHLLEGHVRPTLEVLVTEAPGHLRRRFAPEFGMALIDLAEEPA